MKHILKSEQDVREAIVLECFRAGSQKLWAEKHGLSQAVLSGVLCGHRPISGKLAALVGYERVAAFRKKDV